MSVITKQYNNRVHTSARLPPIQASLKNNEGYVYQSLLDKLKKIKQKLEIHNLVRVGDLRERFSKKDTTNWSYRLYEFTEIFNDTIPSYKINQFPERYKETLLRRTELTLKENDSDVKKLYVT